MELMVSAPTPGVGKRKEAASAAATVMTITIRGHSWQIAPGNLPFAERGAVRKATGGLPIESYWDGNLSVGIDSIQVLWWLARRASGEPGLGLDAALDDWPSDLTEDDIGVEITEPDETNPEA